MKSVAETLKLLEVEMAKSISLEDFKARARRRGVRLSKFAGQMRAMVRKNAKNPDPAAPPQETLVQALGFFESLVAGPQDVATVKAERASEQAFGDAARASLMRGGKLIKG